MKLLRLLALALTLLSPGVAHAVDWSKVHADHCLFPDNNGVFTCMGANMQISYQLSATSTASPNILLAQSTIVGDVPYSAFQNDPCLHPNGSGVRTCTSPDGTHVFTYQSTNTTQVNPPPTVMPTVASLSALPSNIVFAIDANEPVTNNTAPAAGTAGINYYQPLNSITTVSDLLTFANYKSGSGGYATLYLGSGPNGFSFFRDTPQNAFDNFVPPAANFGPLFGPFGSPYWGMALINQSTSGALSLFQAQNGGYSIQQVLAGRNGATDCALNLQQNNGTANVSETSGPLTVCGQWEVLIWGTDGSKFYIWRNGTLTASGSGNPIGFGNLGPTNVEFANQCSCETVFWLMGGGLPSQAGMNAFLSQVYTQYGIIGSQLTTWPTTTGIAPAILDQTSSYLTTPNFPTANAYASNILPVVTAAVPGDGLALTSGATNVADAIFGTGVTGANITTGAKVRQSFFFNYISGNLNNTIGSPMDTGQGGNAPFNAVARHYAVGDPNDIHVIEADGLHLKAICSGNHLKCGYGHIYGAMIRTTGIEFVPGMTVKWRYKNGAAKTLWTPMWAFSGEQDSPGPGGNPYLNFGQTNSLYRGSAGTSAPSGPVSKGNYFEIDANDDFTRMYDYGIPLGSQFDFGTPNIYGSTWNTAPYNAFHATGNGYSYYSNGAPAEGNTNVHCTTAFCDMVLSWRNDGSNLLDEFVNGVLQESLYMESNNGHEEQVTTPSGTTRPLGMHLILGNQAVPGFYPGYNSSDTFVTENEGLPEGWDLTIQELAVWNGTIANPASYKPAGN